MKMSILILFIVAILATLVVAGGIFYLLVKHWFDSQRKEQLVQMKIDERRETLKVVTAIRLQAYERVALFLARMSPDSVVMRC